MSYVSVWFSFLSVKMLFQSKCVWLSNMVYIWILIYFQLYIILILVIWISVGEFFMAKYISHHLFIKCILRTIYIGHTYHNYININEKVPVGFIVNTIRNFINTDSNFKSRQHYLTKLNTTLWFFANVISNVYFSHIILNIYINIGIVYEEEKYLRHHKNTMDFNKVLYTILQSIKTHILYFLGVQLNFTVALYFNIFCFNICNFIMIIKAVVWNCNQIYIPIFIIL